MACLRLICIALICAAPTVYAKIGVICTLNQELKGVVEFANAHKQQLFAGRTFFLGEVNNVPLVVVRSPMGKVNNAITSQILISQFKVGSIISIGLAGGLKSSIDIGDVILANETVQHDTGTVNSYGFTWTAPTEFGVSRKIDIHNWLKKNSYPVGKLVSGDQFIADTAKRDWLVKKFDALAVDTNSAAISQACKQSGISCLFVRLISDKADSDARLSFDSLSRQSKVGTLDVLKSFLKFTTGYNHDVL